MKAQVNLVTREVYEFDIAVERPFDFLGKIKPLEIFHRPVHQVLGKVKTVSLNPETIEWIELDADELPRLPPTVAALTIRQLSLDAFKHWVTEQKDVITAVMEQEGPQNVVTTYGKATFKSGRTLYLQITAKVERIEDRIKASQKIFGMPALFVYGECSGVFIVNPANVAVWQVVPGLKRSGFFSLQGELVSVTKVG